MSIFDDNPSKEELADFEVRVQVYSDKLATILMPMISSVLRENPIPDGRIDVGALALARVLFAFQLLGLESIGVSSEVFLLIQQSLVTQTRQQEARKAGADGAEGTTN